MEWSADSGVYRQAFQNRVNESTFMPFSNIKPHKPVGAAGTPANRPLVIISGGGKFYDFNLDFGCCFGTLMPPAGSEPGPAVVSLEDYMLQTLTWRTLLINGSSAGLLMYAHNTEQDRGDAHTASSALQTCSLCIVPTVSPWHL